ncbi:MAG: exonuclease domain-containing protein [Planctomycetaceae bacterium]
MGDHPNYHHEREAIEWARSILDQPDRYAILDTETTGLTNDDEVIQLGILSPTGDVLLDRLIRPSPGRSIHPGAQRVHNISMAMLADKPAYGQISDEVREAVRGRRIVTYNAAFDLRLMTQTARAAGGFVPPDPWDCAMLMYAQFVGDADHYRGEYRWHKLRGGDHTAVGDCRATLEYIRTMAVATPRMYSYDLGASDEGNPEAHTAAIIAPPPQREQRAPRRSMQSMSISIDMDGVVRFNGEEYRPPTIDEQDSELDPAYRKALAQHEAAVGTTVASMADIVRFLTAAYRDLTVEQMDSAVTHSAQARISGIPYIVFRAVKCFAEIKTMQDANAKALFRIAERTDSLIDHIAFGLPHGDRKIKAEAQAIVEAVQSSARNELFFRSQIIWTDMWDRTRDKITTIEKKSDRKKATNAFIQSIKDLCDARCFRGLKDERDRFVDYVKAQCFLD